MNPSIAADPSVLRVDESGTIRVGSTRVSLDSLVASFRAGATPEQIAQDFESLSLADIYSAIGYYLNHQKEMDDYIASQERLAEEFRSCNPRLYARGVRERLMAR